MHQIYSHHRYLQEVYREDGGAYVLVARLSDLKGAVMNIAVHPVRRIR